MTMGEILYLIGIYWTSLFILFVLLLPLALFLGFMFYAMGGFVFSYLREKNGF